MRKRERLRPCHLKVAKDSLIVLRIIDEKHTGEYLGLEKFYTMIYISLNVLWEMQVND